MNNKLISERIDGATRLGHEHLSKGNLNDACSSFEKAVQLAEDLKDGFTERACYFNLGACYVAQGDPKRGVEFLLKACPPDKESDGRTNYADLQYNLGTAYDALGDLHKAVECYDTAAEEYKTQENRHTTANEIWGVCSKPDFKSWDTSQIKKTHFQFCKRELSS